MCVAVVSGGREEMDMLWLRSGNPIGLGVLNNMRLFQRPFEYVFGFHVVISQYIFPIFYRIVLHPFQHQEMPSDVHNK